MGSLDDAVLSTTGIGLFDFSDVSVHRPAGNASGVGYGKPARLASDAATDLCASKASFYAGVPRPVSDGHHRWWR